MPVIKRYPNRKLYNTQSKQYIKLEGIAELLRQGQEISVVDYATGEDLSAVTLSQVILELEKRVGGLLPRPVLAGLIQARNNTLEAVRSALLSPLDLALHVDEEIQRRVEISVKEGEVDDPEGQRILDLLVAREWKVFPSKGLIEQKVQEALSSLDLPTKDDLKILLEQVETLTAALDELAPKSADL